jgi:hypothetical protein
LDGVELNSLYIELTQAGINIAFNKLEILMRSHLIIVFNPFENYFQNLEKWDGENHIQRLTSFVKTTDREPFPNPFRKMVDKICSLCIENEDTSTNNVSSFAIPNKTAERQLFEIPDSTKFGKYYTEDIGVDKDGLIALCKNFIINIDELSVMSKTDVNILKAFISKNTVNARLPYDRKSSLMYRTSSFCGSTNRSDFLTDETGSVRWIILKS